MQTENFFLLKTSNADTTMLALEWTTTNDFQTPESDFATNVIVDPPISSADIGEYLENCLKESENISKRKDETLFSWFKDLSLCLIRVEVESKILLEWKERISRRDHITLEDVEKLAACCSDFYGDRDRDRDVALIFPCGDKLLCHKIFLLAHFEFFEPLFNGGWTTTEYDTGLSRITAIRLEDCKPETMNAVLSYCYSGNLLSFTDVDIIFDSIVLCDALLSNSLKALLFNLLRSSITEDSVLLILSKLDNLERSEIIASIRKDCLSLLLQRFHTLKDRPDFALCNLTNCERQSLEIFNAFILKRSAEVGWQGPRLGIDCSTACSGCFLGDSNDGEEGEERLGNWAAVTCYLREVLDASAEVLRDSRERYEESRAANEQDLRDCLRDIEVVQAKAIQIRRGSLSFFPFIGSNSTESVLQHLQERKGRMLKVQANLLRQKAALQTQTDFYHQQRAALDRLVSFSTFSTPTPKT